MRRPTDLLAATARLAAGAVLLLALAAPGARAQSSRFT